MAEQATVRIHRPKQFSGMGNVMAVEVDGREVGQLRNGHDLVTHVEAGRRNVGVRFGPRGDLLELGLAPGADARLEARYTGSVFLRPKLVQIGADAPVQPPVAEVRTAPSATVRFHRPKQFRGMGSVMAVEVDGREVGQLRNGHDLVTHVEAGRRNVGVRFGPRGDLLELGLAPGADARLEARYTGSVFLRPKLVQIRVDPPVPEAQVLGTTETHQSAEPIGTQELLIENRSDAARLTRTSRVTREWSRTVSLHLRESHGGFDVGEFGPAWLKFVKRVEEHLSREYEVEKYQRVEFTEEFTVDVEPGSAVTIVLAWKRILQHGVVHDLFQGQQVDIPYEVAVGLNFDQSLVQPG